MEVEFNIGVPAAGKLKVPVMKAGIQIAVGEQADNAWDSSAVVGREGTRCQYPAVRLNGDLMDVVMELEPIVEGWIHLSAGIGEGMSVTR